MKTTSLAIGAGVTTLLALLSICPKLLAQHPLDSWVRRAVPGPNSPLNGVAYGNATFVAVGDDSFVARSSNGATWTTSTAGSYGTLKRVRFLDGQFVAVGASDKILFSSDGASWTANTLPRADFWDVAWGDGVYVLAGVSTYISLDGVNWTQIHPMLPHPFFPPYETQLDTVLFANGRFVALPPGTGPNGTGKQTLFST